MDNENVLEPLFPEEEETLTPETEEEEISSTRYFFQVVYRLRGLLLSIPVVVAAILMAVYSSRYLPAQVGLFMQSSGTYQFYISRTLAITVPLIITGASVTLTLCAKKITFPWFISLFSLIVPAILWLTTALTS